MISHHWELGLGPEGKQDAEGFTSTMGLVAAVWIETKGRGRKDGWMQRSLVPSLGSCTGGTESSSGLELQARQYCCEGPSCRDTRQKSKEAFEHGRDLWRVLAKARAVTEGLL